jgi:Zn-dependent M28 family amino/carboxypeptidase
MRRYTAHCLLLLAIGCSSQNASPSVALDLPDGPTNAAQIKVDSVRLLGHLRFLSDPRLEGRAAGSSGNDLAREYIEQEFRTAGAEAFGGAYLRTFPLDNGNPGGAAGTNVVGYVEGTERRDRYIVVSAHFDHLGNRDGTIYPGADDNASGTAALLEIGRQLAAQPAGTSVILAALDAEELGLRGARAFVTDPPVPLESITLNVNLDMVSRNEAGEIYVAGTYQYPDLAALVEPVAERSEVTVLRGHDRPDLPPGDDWTQQSDHAAFHEVGIPFIYFGVEDHPDYHRPTDTFENIDPAFFVRVTRTILDFIHTAGQ